MKSQQAQVAQLIKAKLKTFGIKCTAKSSSFSMGDSVDIKVINQPPWIMEAIREQTDCFEYGTFDGMTDCQGVKNRDFDGPQTKYLHIGNTFTDDVEKAAWIELCGIMEELQGKEDEDYNNLYLPDSCRYASQMLYQYMNGSLGNICYFKKPKVKASINTNPAIVSNNNQYSIEEHTHTKKQTQIFICVNAERVSREEFTCERDRAKSLNGWYSRKWGAAPCGFAFNSLVEAERFVNNHEPTEPTEPKKLDNVVSINTNADIKKADKFRKLADKMTAKIDDCFRDRPTHTARMMAQYQKSRVDGQKIERAQKLLIALAEGLENNTLSDELRKINSKMTALSVVATKLEMVNNGYHGYHVCTGEPLYPDDVQVKQAFDLISGSSEEEQEKEKVRDLQNKISNVKNSSIPGYFPTTGDALQQLIDLSDIDQYHRCLEPSAGRGDIADELLKHTKLVDCIEYNNALAEILELKGHSVSHSDFLGCQPDFTRYDRIVMNPPFERDNAALHIEHALDFLTDDGLLVSVIPNGMMDKNTPKIRNLKDRLNGDYEIIDMDQDSFKSEGTRINTQIIKIWS